MLKNFIFLLPCFLLWYCGEEKTNEPISSDKKPVEEKTPAYDYSHLMTCSFSFDSLRHDTKENSYFLNDSLYTGCAIRNFPNSTRFNIYEFQAGLITHEVGFYNKNRVALDCHFKEGLDHGRHLFYHENGQLHLEQNYVNDKLHGTLKRWSKGGELLEVIEARNGVAISKKYPRLEKEKRK